jgi:2-dehydro-3-deoxygluconokinase
MTMMRSGRIVSFGEILLRLAAPGRELLLQSGRLDVCVGGAEANVAVALASLGQEVAMVSGLPDNPLGRSARDFLRGHGVDTGPIIWNEARMGLYFLTLGAGLRASEVIYDRAESAFVKSCAQGFDWPRLLEGAGLLHLSGITPALGTDTAEAAIAAAETANAMGVPVAFDGNYRARLWQTWDSNPREILTRLIASADILFGNYRDISLVLGTEFSGEGADRRCAAAEAAFARFDRLQIIASTARHVDDADKHRIAARVDTRPESVQTGEVVIAGIVDRIGTGDAFAAGILNGLKRGHTLSEVVHGGLALAVLKHSLPGDASLFRQVDIDAYLSGVADVRR